MKRFALMVLCCAPSLCGAEPKPWGCTRTEQVCAEAGESSHRCKAQRGLFADKCAEYWNGTDTPVTSAHSASPSEYSGSTDAQSRNRVLDRQRDIEQTQQQRRDEQEAAYQQQLAEARRQQAALEQTHAQDMRKADYLRLQIEAIQKDIALADRQLQRDRDQLKALIDRANSTAMSQSQRAQFNVELRGRRDAYAQQVKQHEWDQMQRQHELDDLTQQYAQVRKESGPSDGTRGCRTPFVDHGDGTYTPATGCSGSR